MKRINFKPNREKLKELRISDLVAVQKLLQQKYTHEPITGEKMYLLNCISATVDEIDKRIVDLFTN